MTALDDAIQKYAQSLRELYNFLSESKIHDKEWFVPVVVYSWEYTTNFNFDFLYFLPYNDSHSIIDSSCCSSRKQLDEATYIQDQGPLHELNPGTAKSFTKSTMNTLNVVLSYSKCYPYIKTHALIDKISNVWEAFCEKNLAITKQLRRKILVMKADPKADPFILTNTETASVEWCDACALSNIGLYRMRVLNSLHHNKTTS